MWQQFYLVVEVECVDFVCSFCEMGEWWCMQFVCEQWYCNCDCYDLLDDVLCMCVQWCVCCQCYCECEVCELEWLQVFGCEQCEFQDEIQILECYLIYFMMCVVLVVCVIEFWCEYCLYVVCCIFLYLYVIVQFDLQYFFEFVEWCVGLCVFMLVELCICVVECVLYELVFLFECQFVEIYVDMG